MGLNDSNQAHNFLEATWSSLSPLTKGTKGQKCFGQKVLLTPPMVTDFPSVGTNIISDSLV